MGSLPRAKAGIGSAMNDVVREVGGTLGVAVLGSVLPAATARAWTGDRRAAPAGRGGGERQRRRAHEIGAQIGGGAGAALIDTANSAFVDAMTTTATLAPRPP